jgi:hypothetical protein
MTMVAPTRIAPNSSLAADYRLGAAAPSGPPVGWFRQVADRASGNHQTAVNSNG